MRYYIIFGITVILLIFICNYNPNKKYLGIYENELNIKYDYNEEGYNWKYDTDCDELNIKEINKDEWNFSVNKKGTCEITFNYINEETNDLKYSIYYKFKINNKKIYWLEGNGLGLLDYPNPY